MGSPPPLTAFFRRAYGAGFCGLTERAFCASETRFFGVTFVFFKEIGFLNLVLRVKIVFFSYFFALRAYGGLTVKSQSRKWGGTTS